MNAETAYCQIVADEIGLRIEDVFYQAPRLSRLLRHGAGSSTNLSVNGFAVRHAARKLKRDILDAATSPTGGPRAAASRRGFPASG